MARKPETPKAITFVKHDFVTSLDNLIHQGSMLLSAVEAIIQNNSIPNNGVAQLLAEHAKKFRAAMYAQEGE